MFDISTVTLENFRSFKGRHTWVLPQGPGLCFLTGRNDDNPALIRNGAGKSTLLESIVWCLYDKTSRGLKATDIVTWGCKKASVTVELWINDAQFMISRTRNPNTLTVNGNVVDNETLVKLIRLSYDEFLYSVIFSQFNETFFDLSSANKLALFSKIMKLDVWLELSQQAVDEAKDIEKVRNAISFDIARMTGSQLSLKESIEELKEKALNWDADKSKKVFKLSRDYDLTGDKLLGIDSDLESVKKCLSGLEPKIKKLDDLVRVTNDDMELLKKDVGHLNVKLIAYQSDVSHLDVNLKQLSGLDSKCPTCWQQVDEKHLIVEKDKIFIKKSRLQLIIAEIENDKKILTEEYYVLDKKLSNYQVQRNERIEEKRDCESLIREFDTEDRQTRYEMEKLQQEIKNIKASKNEYSNMLEAKVVEIGKLQDDIQLNKAKIDQLNKQYEAVEYWVSGFKKLRLLVIEETLCSLEIEINNSLESLGLVNWKVKFDIERENKSGGVTKGFVVFIQPPNQESVRWEAYSGGETQLLRLAGALGLSNLIIERAGLNNLLELYDEPSSHVSNVNALVQTLHNRANSLGKKIILVDHSAIEYPFDSEVLVIKDRNGSRIEV